MRIHIIVRTAKGIIPKIDVNLVEKEISNMTKV